MRGVPPRRLRPWMKPLAPPLIQTGKSPLVPVVLLDEPGGSYWQEFLAFTRHQLVENRYVLPSDLKLVRPARHRICRRGDCRLLPQLPFQPLAEESIRGMYSATPHCNPSRMSSQTFSWGRLHPAGQRQR